MKKTNAVRLLEAAGIEHEAVTYESTEDEIDAVSVARKIGAEPERVFKTLVTRGGPKEYFVFCIPGNFDLDFKKAAAAAGVKKIEMIAVKELQPLTGYIRGGCSPVGMKKPFPTFVDETAQLHEKIYVSAGVRGMQLHLPPDDLLAAIDAVYADLV